MTFFMFFLAFHSRTPVIAWMIAMLCDTALLITYMLTHGAR